VARIQGEGAAVEAVVAPVAMSDAATASLRLDVVGGAGDLVRPVLREGEPEPVEPHTA
jgi:hypothetical protein